MARGTIMLDNNHNGCSPTGALMMNKTRDVREETKVGGNQRKKSSKK